MSGLSVFRDIFLLPKPSEHAIENFCVSVFHDFQEDPNIVAHVVQVVHFKEKVCSSPG
jgi:hypothetical protein